MVLTKGGHAFSIMEEMVMKDLDDGGTLQFITNGIGEGVWIDTSDMQIKIWIIADKLSIRWNISLMKMETLY